MGNVDFKQKVINFNDASLDNLFDLRDRSQVPHIVGDSWKDANACKL